MTYPRKMKPRTRECPVACAAMVGLVLALAPAASASSDYPQVGDQAASEEFVDESTSYRSCKKMRKYYPRGVAKSSAAGDRARADGFGPAEVNKKVYKANKKLDTNGNRVACAVSDGQGAETIPRRAAGEAEMPTAEAGEYAESAGYQWRVGSLDGVPQAVTMDYNIDRLTFDVNDGYRHRRRLGLVPALLLRHIGLRLSRRTPVLRRCGSVTFTPAVNRWPLSRAKAA